MGTSFSWAALIVSLLTLLFYGGIIFLIVYITMSIKQQKQYQKEILEELRKLTAK